uniref:Endoglucanase n=1 Tax=Ananas comosus var. bracteatus TaxID=296719 RepID=A0A6V7QC32_ANACO|nr:unnamed protein product [Ananas comosus var. bracteatus]
MCCCEEQHGFTRRRTTCHIHCTISSTALHSERKTMTIPSAGTTSVSAPKSSLQRSTTYWAKILPVSYMIGFGRPYPWHVHHREYSIPSVHAHCNHMSCSDGFTQSYMRLPNLNVLVEAVLSGLDENDGFSDEKNSYRQSEPATYINAPMVGAPTFLVRTLMAS